MALRLIRELGDPVLGKKAKTVNTNPMAVTNNFSNSWSCEVETVSITHERIPVGRNNITKT